MSMKVKVNIH